MLYTGKVFAQINPENWRKPKTDIVIVSALFGLIKHYELIPDYNLIMTDKINDTKEIISTFWRNKNIVNLINPNEDIDLLFNKYRMAFNVNGNSIGVTPNINWNDKYGSHKGRWLNEQLNQL
jgi:cytoplasmic iron level regulating protein YaaA (DUF328/UPF0246 family)